jgi:hypothetical protein
MFSAMLLDDFRESSAYRCSSTASMPPDWQKGGWGPFSGGHFKQPVDELNVPPQIQTAHPPRLPLTYYSKNV